MAVKKPKAAEVEAAPVVEVVEETTEIIEAIEPEPETVAEIETPPEQPAETGGFSVYLGPSIRGVIQSGTIFPGPREKAVAALPAAVEKYPLIPALIVTGETLAEDRVKVKTPGNLLYVNYNRLAAGQKSK